MGRAGRGTGPGPDSAEDHDAADNGGRFFRLATELDPDEADEPVKLRAFRDRHGTIRAGVYPNDPPERAEDWDRGAPATSRHRPLPSWV